MDSEPDRNPSPPPELLQRYQDLLPDRVGDSVFSKQWLIQILISIVEAVNKESSDCSSANDLGKKTVANEDIHELDPKLEDDACSLWDMSSNCDVAHFLHEFKVADIFLEVIEKTKSPRLLEIAVGILGNMASFDDLCQDLSENELILKSVIPLTGSSDAPTIVQALRLIHTGVVNEKAGELWLDVLRADSSFMKNIKFMLENSLNGEVLKGALQLLYYILDKEEEVCVEWADRDYAKAVIVAGKQLLMLTEFESIDELWLLLNLMFQHDENVSVISLHFDDLLPIYHAYLTRFCDYDYSFLPPVHRVAAVAACFTTLATLLRCDNVSHDVFVEDKPFLQYIEKMFKSVGEVLEKGAIIERGPPNDKQPARNEFDALEGGSEREDRQGSATCNGDSRFSSAGKLTRSVSLHENDYNSLFILKETMVELCTIIMPSVLPIMDNVR